MSNFTRLRNPLIQWYTLSSIMLNIHVATTLILKKDWMTIGMYVKKIGIEAVRVCESSFL